MTSIVANILSSTIGLLWNKARDTTAAKLHGGGVTDENIRKIVVRELNDIKTKLESLSRKDLRSSCSFLEEGVDFLYVALDKSNPKQKASTIKTNDNGSETSSMTSRVQCRMFNEVLELSRLMGKLNANAEKEIQEAEDRFKYARIKATEAFSNEALSIKDMILAAELRIVSQIFERLDNPEIAITGCLSVLKRLHSLPAIQEIFNVYMNGGVKSLINKSERVASIKSVMLLNYVVCKFISNFGSKYPVVLAWPTIEITDRSFNPILHWQELSTRKCVRDELPQDPSRLKFTEELCYYDFAVNGYGDVVSVTFNSVIAISKTGKRKEIKLPAAYRECEIVCQQIEGVAVDKNNNIYVVRWLKTHTVNGDEEISHVLYILDENYNVKREYKLGFFKATIIGGFLKIAINKNNDIVMSWAISEMKNSEVFVCDDRGNLKHKFERDPCWLRSLSISDKNEIILQSQDAREVHVYSEQGNLKSTIKLPESHFIRDVAFHYVFGKIIVLTRFEKISSFLLCYTEEVELENTTYFCKVEERIRRITSHPSGPVVVVTEKSITFI